MTLKPPRSKRIYVVLIDPDTKPKKTTRSLTVYNITLDECYEKVKKMFEEKT
jgi:hypothetical protein